MAQIIGGIEKYGEKSIFMAGKEYKMVEFDRDAPHKYPPGTVMKLHLSPDGTTVSAFIKPTPQEIKEYASDTPPTQVVSKNAPVTKKEPAKKVKEPAPAVETAKPATTPTLSKDALQAFRDVSEAPVEVIRVLKEQDPDLYEKFESLVKCIRPEKPEAKGEFRTAADELNIQKDMRKLIGDVARADPKFVTDMFDREPELMQGLVKKIQDATGMSLMNADDIDRQVGPYPAERELLEMARSSDGYWRAKFYLDLSAKAEIRDAVRGKVWGYSLGRAAQVVLHATPPASKTPDEILMEIVRIAKEIIKLRNATILREVTGEEVIS